MPEDNSKPPDRRSGPSFSLPAWLDHFNARDMKNLFRSWLATWVATILMYIQPSLNSIGLATFFAPLVLYLIPPVGVASAYLMDSFFLLLGMCLAWTWGVITMKAAYAARPSSQTQALVQQLNEQAMLASQKSGESVSWESQRLVREGFMLDARVVVVFYVMSCIYIYTMARVRVANPKFTPGVTFGNIVLDIFLLYGPTLPSFTGELGRVLVLPGAIGIGLGLVCCLLFFPQSTSYSVLAQIGGIVMTCHKSLQYTRGRLAGKPVDSPELQSAKAKLTSSFQAMQTMLSFLPIDMSRCRWSTKDINSLEIPLHKLILVHLILFDYHITRARSVEQNIIDDQSEKVPSADELYQAGPGLALVLDIPELGSIRAQTRQSIKDSTDRLLDLYSDCLCLIAETLRSINNNRWMPSTSAEQPEQIAARGEQLLTQLRRCREETVSKTMNSLIQCHADIFTEDGLLMSPELLHFQSLRSLALGLVLEEHILQCVIAGEKLLTHVLQLSNDRTVKRIWLPSGPKYALSWLCNGFRESPLFLSLSRADRDPEIAERDIEMAHQEPGPKNAYKGPSQLGFYARIIHDTYHWLTNDAGVYALRMVVVTIATAIPASLPHTAGFFYREKGLWGVITAQLCVLVYMADCIFSLSGRVVGTVAGGLLGMVAWYIGSGSGPGNPYGLSVITAVMTLVIVWSRIFFPHELTGMTVMSGVTFVLVMGFSYDATHLQDYGFPGYGYEAFYKRVVTVLLGIMAAFIVQILPRPPSARLHIRKSLSRSVHGLVDQYSILLSCWNREDTEWITSKTDQMSLKLAERLQALQRPLSMLSFEPKMGPFSQGNLRHTQELCMDINQALVTLLGLHSTLPLSFQNRLVSTVGFLDKKNFADIMAVLRLIEQALKTGDALPQHLPALRSAVYPSLQDHVTELSTTLIRDNDYRLYCVAVTSYLKFLWAIDELVMSFKKDLGEDHIIGGLYCAASV